MRRHRSLEHTPLDPEIDRTYRTLRREQQARLYNMADQQENQRTMKDYFKPAVTGDYSGIQRLPIHANNFELKPALIHMVHNNQYGGLPSEDPNAHLATFLEICDTVKMNGVDSGVIRARLFPFSLRDQAKVWLQAQPTNSISS